jgi:bifunctional DNA-binding transcriptional regulator/antitoxin component of YhaV-PrlF toxin-antitoxin module
MSIATLLPDGKIELPEEIRHFLHLQVGSQLSFTIAQDQVVVQTVGFTAHPAQLLARSYKPQRHNLVDEFIAERRESATHEP